MNVRLRKVERSAVIEAKKGFVPENTTRSTEWAMKIRLESIPSRLRSFHSSSLTFQFPT
uniref:Uncharacterized protein n=1 Tax=Amphimedon queenslandica TaxID=400682 RepID=A0A1X7SZH0_AMPQE